MQAQTELGPPGKLDAKGRTLKMEGLEEAGVEVLRLRKQHSSAACQHTLGHDACILSLDTRAPLSGTVTNQ